MTRKQRLVLANLAHAGAVPLAALASRLGGGATLQAMQCTVRILERKGLVARRYEMLDGRQHVLVELTAQGAAYAAGLRVLGGPVTRGAGFGTGPGTTGTP